MPRRLALLGGVVAEGLPKLSYDFDLADGGTASNALEDLLTTPEQIPEAERATLRQQLLTYCNHDTLVMVELWKWLNNVAAA